jgi:lysophospholipase L1-like esterase
MTSQPANDKVKTVVLLGASYAAGWILDPFSDFLFINKGIDGNQSFEMLDRFETDVLTQHPDIVILWGFINDFQRSGQREWPFLPDRIIANFRKMIALARKHQIIPILGTELTIRPPKTLRELTVGVVAGVLGKKSYQTLVNEQVLLVNEILKRTAVQYHLHLLDLQPVLSGKKGQRKFNCAIKDGSHISEDGYVKLTDYLKEKIENYQS